MLKLNELRYWLALLNVPGIGPAKFFSLLKKFPQIEELFKLSTVALSQFNFTETMINAIKKPDWDRVEADLTWAQQAGCFILPWSDTAYPSLLREIAAPPPLLFGKGDKIILQSLQLAVVGSRNPTATGAELAKRFAHDLSRLGFTITSGLALGIDAAAHQGALTAKGPTIAVLGSGLERIYPIRHKQLAELITQQGVLLSEYSPSAPPKAEHFPQRNRIISGLARGVLVVEAALQSGSLITARLAVEQGREVFAMPGSIHNSLAKGCHVLIRQGAKLVETITDIVEEFAGLLKNIDFVVTSVDSIEHVPLLTHLGYEPTSIDTLIERTQMSVGELANVLLSLELKGLIEAVPGGYMRRGK